MKKLMVCVPALALAVVLSGSAFAENGSIGDTTLNAMGLSGIQVMSDSDASDVRGHGYRPSKKPWNRTYGSSSSSININHRSRRFGSIRFNTRTRDGFRAEGRYRSGGMHASESYFDIVRSHTEVTPEGTVEHIRALSITIGSGGSASSYSL